MREAEELLETRVDVVLETRVVLETKLAKQRAVGFGDIAQKHSTVVVQRGREARIPQTNEGAVGFFLEGSIAFGPLRRRSRLLADEVLVLLQPTHKVADSLHVRRVALQSGAHLRVVKERAEQVVGLAGAQQFPHRLVAATAATKAKGSVERVGGLLGRRLDGVLHRVEVGFDSSGRFGGGRGGIQRSEDLLGLRSAHLI